MSMQTFLKAICAALGGVAGFLWGDLDGLLVALFCFIGFDFITGLVVALDGKALNSEVCFKGLLKKGIMLAIVAVAHILDTQILHGESSVCRSAVICFYCANEGMSILENAGKLGIPLPKKLREVLAQLKENEEDHKDE